MSLPKYDVDLARKLVLLIQEGNYITTACACVGLDYSTFKRWQAKGEEPDAPEHYRAFSATVKRARAQAEANALRNIRAAGLDPRHWQANAWFLERSFREKWKPPTTRVQADQTIDLKQALTDTQAAAATYTDPDASPDTLLPPPAPETPDEQ